MEACLAAYLETPERDLEKLVGYGDRLGNGAVFKRLGFLLSRRPDAPPAAVAACRSRLKSGNVKLDPALACAQLVTRWKLWVPKPWKPVEDGLASRVRAASATTNPAPDRGGAAPAD